MSNSGGAWDNAKKYIEKQSPDSDLKGKGSDIHKAAGNFYFWNSKFLGLYSLSWDPLRVRIGLWIKIEIMDRDQL